MCPVALVGRFGFDVNTSQVFLHGVLAAITMVGGGAGDGGAMAGARCEAGLPLCSVSFTTLLGEGRGGSQDAGAEALKVGSELVLFPFLSPITSTSAPQGSSATARGACAGSWFVTGHRL